MLESVSIAARESDRWLARRQAARSGEGAWVRGRLILSSGWWGEAPPELWATDGHLGRRAPRETVRAGSPAVPPGTARRLPTPSSLFDF